MANSKFHKAQYEAIARAVREAKLDADTECLFEGVMLLQAKLAKLFKVDNPSFHTTKFIQSCTV